MGTVIHFNDGSNHIVQEAVGLVRDWMEQRKMVTVTSLNGEPFAVNTDNVKRIEPTRH